MAAPGRWNNVLIALHDILHVSVRQVFRQRRSSLGIVLAVALGTASLITVLTLGDQLKHDMNRDLDLLGGATVIVAGFTVTDSSAPPQAFLPETVNAIRALPGVEAASAATEHVDWLSLFWRGDNIATPVIGVDEDYWRASGLEAIKGSLFTVREVREGERVCVLGEELAKELFGDQNPVGQYLPIRTEIFKIIGVVGGLQVGDRKKFALLPLTTVVRRSDGVMRADRLIVRCRTWDDVPVVGAAIASILAQRQDPRYLKVAVATKQLERVVSMVWWVQLFVAVSIAATLTVGGFGIWNGMMNAVTTRTREIGLKKAMGAERNDILAQFLCEALTLSLSAALVGIALAFILVQTAGCYLEVSPSLGHFLLNACLSFVFSAALGVATGFYPAKRAARMDAVVAIRYE
ncbi:MAG: ABC transporter permease [Humidesulfovibrio sp.]|nr:ABC transporter permease [Humidesulfovibrio sp.]